MHVLVARLELAPITGGTLRPKVGYEKRWGIVLILLIRWDPLHICGSNVKLTLGNLAYQSSSLSWIIKFLVIN